MVLLLVELLQYEEIPAYSLIPCALVGIIIFLIIYILSSKKNLKYFLLPYIIFACFGALVYFSGHHIGVALNLFLFWLWIAMEDPERFYGWKKIKTILCKTEKDAVLLKKAGRLWIFLCLAVSLYWSIASSVQDIRYEYSYGRETAVFLKKTGLDHASIFCGWSDSRPNSTKKIDRADADYVSTNFAGTPMLITAYFDSNIVENFNDGKEAYLHQHYNSTAENEADFTKWSRLDPPDVLLDRIDGIEDIFNSPISMEDYSIVYVMRMNYIWKGYRSPYTNFLYVRNDLLSKYGLTPIEDDGSMILPSYQLTSEQMEGLRNGTVSLSDIIGFMKEAKN